MARAVTTLLAGAALLFDGAAVAAQTLRGSQHAMQKQNRVAHQHDYTFLQTSADVRRFIDLGLLVELPGNDDYELAKVSHPYARPAVKLFVERLATQYRAACGEKLVITSLTRPVREQPRNASDLSVHPAGMAVDLRVSGRAACRVWLERTLMSLERQGVLDAIRERNPPHYHVALFPEQYTRYVARLSGGQIQVASVNPGAAQASSPRASVQSSPQTAANEPSESADERVRGIAQALESIAELTDSGAIEPAVSTYRINRGDSLWSIARRHGTTVDTLKELNGLKTTQIRAGQVISVPVSTTGMDGS
jgi:LysM repeat protein